MSLTTLGVSGSLNGGLRIMGQITHWRTGVPMPNVRVDLSGGGYTATLYTDASGNYDSGIFTASGATTVSLLDQEANITTGNYVARLASLGITTADESALIAHLNATIPQTGYGLLACDMNTSLSVNSSDRSVMTGLLTGSVSQINAYNPPTGGKIIKFVLASYTMTANPWSPMYPSTYTTPTNSGTYTADFKAVIKGDIV